MANSQSSQLRIPFSVFILFYNFFVALILDFIVSDFLGPCSNIPPTEDPPQQYPPLRTSFIVDSLPGVFAVDKPTNYVVTNSSTVIENKEVGFYTRSFSHSNVIFHLDVYSFISYCV